jgi:hypothetical protein
MGTEPRPIPPEFSGVWIPRELLENNGLTNTAKILFGIVDCLAQSQRGCFGSNAYLARIVSRDPRTVRRELQILERLGYLVRVKGDRRKIRTATSDALVNRRLNVAVSIDDFRPSPPDKNVLPPRTKMSSRYNEKIKPNPTPTPSPRSGRASKPARARLTREDYEGGF